MGNANRDEEELNQPLVESSSASSCFVVVPDVQAGEEDHEMEKYSDLKSKVWLETKKLWHIVGPTIFSSVALYSMNLITQAFVGHLGDLELASFTIANNIIVGFSFGLLLGMSSALGTLCGQAYGAKRHHMLGIYLQRSWIVLSMCCILLLPLYVFATPLLKLLGQADDVAEQAGLLALWSIPLHFNLAFQFPVQMFLQSQLRTAVLAWVSLAVLVVHVGLSWVFVNVLEFGVAGGVAALGVSWWLMFFGLLGYTLLGGCPDTWTGFSMDAFSGLWEFVKLSAASGVMLCLEIWYYKVLILMAANLKNATIAVDALSICTGISGWEMMIPMAFLSGTRVRVGNELGARNVKGAKFATIVSLVQSTIVGLFFCTLIMVLDYQIASIFTSSADILEAVDNLSLLLAISILLNSIQPVLSGVAVGSGWQAKVAFVNLGCYYVVGLPLGIVLGWVCNLGAEGIWGGMIFGGTATQTIILAIIILRCNWEEEAEKATVRVNKWSTPKPHTKLYVSVSLGE